jgi:DNA-binding response OmpR family regulator
MMPLLDGIGLCRQVKATWQTAVILMSSAPPQQSHETGEDAFIAKPFDLDRLEQVVEAVLSSNANGDTAPGSASPVHA